MRNIRHSRKLSAGNKTRLGQSNRRRSREIRAFRFWYSKGKSTILDLVKRQNRRIKFK